MGAHVWGCGRPDDKAEPEYRDGGHRKSERARRYYKRMNGIAYDWMG
jgi:hypothetical protein